VFTVTVQAVTVQTWMASAEFTEFGNEWRSSKC
jgi:hypothetical protein